MSMYRNLMQARSPPSVSRSALVGWDFEEVFDILPHFPRESGRLSLIALSATRVDSEMRRDVTLAIFEAAQDRGAEFDEEGARWLMRVPRRPRPGSRTPT